jgi:hypothetical protein
MAPDIEDIVQAQRQHGKEQVHIYRKPTLADFLTR